MLGRLEIMSLNDCMMQIAEFINSEDWNRMQSVIDRLKGSSWYVGAGRIYYACYNMQKELLAKNISGMI